MENWESAADVMRETAKKVLEVLSGRKKEDRKTWWWNEEAQEYTRRKRSAKKNWDSQRNEESKREYKEMCCKAKSEVAKA